MTRRRMAAMGDHASGYAHPTLYETHMRQSIGPLVKRCDYAPSAVTAIKIT